MSDSTPDRADRPHVIMATEGTYPFMGGGVSTWCHQICEGLESIDFSILAVTGDTDVKWKYDRLPTVKRVMLVPMWPGEEPGMYLYPGRYSGALRRRWRTTRAVIKRHFIPPLRVLLQEIFIGGVGAERLISAIVDVGVYLQTYDYKTSMRDKATWREFVDVAERFDDRQPAGTPPVTIEDATVCARWFYNMMMPLAVPLPEGSVFHSTIAAACALPGIVLQRTRGIPFVVTDHGVYLRERYINISRGDFSQIQKRFLIGLAIAIGRACYVSADIISPVARFNQRWEVPWGAPEERIRVIYNGVDTERYQPGEKPPERQSRPTVVAAARVFPLKDVETMIRGADVARRTIEDIHVLCYGSLKADPEYVAGCRALIDELGVGHNFEFGGFHPDPYGIFIEGDISVLSSISEGFPYTVLEAMSSGVPCVATDVGGVREAVGDTGIVVPPRNPEALGAGLVELLQDEDRRLECSRRARERVLTEFTIAKQLHNYESLYHEMHRLSAERCRGRDSRAGSAAG